MEPGGIAFVDYGERPVVWHTRLLLAPTNSTCWVILTPDLDAYEEEMDIGNPDFQNFHYAGPTGVIPPHIDRRRVYSFAPLSPGDLGRHMQQGRVTANAIRAAAGLPPLPPLAAAAHPVAPPQPAVPPPVPAYVPVPGMLGGALPPAAPAVPAAVAGVGAQEQVNTWVAVEEVGQIKRGQILAVEPAALPAGSLIASDHAIVPDGPKFIFARKVKASEVEGYKLEDLRVLPVVFDGQGIRRREFYGLCSHLNDSSPQGGGLQLEGPATVLRLCKMMRDSNLTPTTFHEYWLRSADIPKGDRSVYEHECLSRIFEAMLTVDQLNAPALQSAELVSRRMPVIREAHRISPGSPDYSSADIMMGWRYRRAGQGVDQELAAHVATELKNEAAIAKESRKAREEAEARRRAPNKKGKNAQEGAGGGQT